MTDLLLYNPKNMIKEDYVSLKTARLLKDKGFRCVTNRYYNAQYDEIGTVSDTFMMDWNDEAYMKKLGMEGAIAIPTLQVTMKWLREVHDIHLSITPFDIEPRVSGRIVRYIPEIYTLPSKGYEMDCVGMNVCNSYEEAANAAILHALKNLIDL